MMHESISLSLLNGLKQFLNLEHDELIIPADTDTALSTVLERAGIDTEQLTDRLILVYYDHCSMSLGKALTKLTVKPGEKVTLVQMSKGG